MYYKNHKIKIYSVIILSLLLFDFFINFQEKNIPQDVLEPEDYKLLTCVKEVINSKNDIDQDILRLSQKQNKPIYAVIKTFLNQICLFDKEISEKMYNNYESKFLKYRLHVQEYKINQNRLDTILNSLKEQPDEEIMIKASGLNVKRYKVYFLGNKRSNYIIDTSAIGQKNIFWGKQFYIKSTTHDKKHESYVENSRIYSIYSAPVLWSKLSELSSNSPQTSNYEACKLLMLGIDNNVGVIINGQYYYLGYYSKNNDIKSIKFRVNKQDMSLDTVSCYFCNDIINNYTYHSVIKLLEENNVDNRDKPLEVGHIDYVGEMLDYDIFAGLVNCTLDKGVEEQILRCTVRDIWNNRKEFIVSTLKGMYLIVVSECDDANVLRKVLAINKAVILAANTPEKEKIIQTPKRHPNSFVHTLKRCYNIDFPGVVNKNITLIKYNNGGGKTDLVVRSSDIKYGDTFSDYSILSLINDGYNFG